MKLTLTIDIGTEGMTTYNHLAMALRKIATKIERGNKFARADTYERSGPIMNIKNNTIGTWVIK